MAVQSESARPESPPTRLSPSVDRVVGKLSSRPSVSGWDIIQVLLEFHPEYGKHTGAEVRKSRGPASQIRKPVKKWLEEVEALLQTDEVAELHGRLLILGLSFLDSELADYLSGEGFLQAIHSEMREPVQVVFRPEVFEPRARSLPYDPAPLVPDQPSAEDQLGRQGFAFALARRLGRIWDEHSRSGARGSFMLHLHGPWGSGKTSLLKLLRKELKRQDTAPGKAEDVISRWIVVEFNAWQYQRLDPPWWFLMDAVFRAAYQQIERCRALRLWWFEHRWRFRTARKDALHTAAIIIFLAGVFYFVFPIPIVRGLSALSARAQQVSDILALFGTILSAVFVVSRSLLPGSAKAAQAFVQSAADPLEKIFGHFRDLLGRIASPVIVFIDDLDRCREDYVVSLLEGIQTLFNDPRVIYVVAADRKWLYTCFEKSYETFSRTVFEPGRRLGSLFLEKAFQLSVAVPRLSEEVKRAYWDYLIRGARGKITDELAAEHSKARQEFVDAATEEEVFARLEHTEEEDPIRLQALRQAAVEHLAKPEVEESTVLFLTPFAPLLEPNPRAMKRLLNAYAVHRDLAILGGLKVLTDLTKRRQLVLWTILSLRWPLLEEHFVARIGRPDTQPDGKVKSLLENPEVGRVLKGDGIDVELPLDAIGEFAGLRPSESTEGAVA